MTFTCEQFHKKCSRNQSIQYVRRLHIEIIITSPGANELTHWGRDKMAAISQTTLSNAFSWMIMLEFRLKFHWSLSIRVPRILFQHWFRWWLGADQATSHYLNQWWLVYWRIYASLGLNELRVNVMVTIILGCVGWIIIASDNSLRPGARACVIEYTIIGSDNGLSPGRHQAIIWTIAGILSIWHLQEQTYNEILIEIHLHSRKCIWKCRLRNVEHLVSASMC